MIGRESFVILGAGGHAKVVASVLEASGQQIVAVLDDDVDRQSESLLGHAVEGPLVRIREYRGVRAIIAVGNNAVRQDIASRFPGIAWGVAVHPSAWVHDSVEIGPGTVVFAGAILQPDVRLGSHVIVSTSASVDHDCVLGDYVHVAPGARLAGDVHVGRETLIGLGSSVLPGLRIGTRVILGAGAVATKDLEEGHVFAGVPATRV